MLDEIARFMALPDELISRIGLIQAKSVVRYFCTPLDAIVFSYTGSDGIHFCIVPEQGDFALENSPVYVVSPMMSDHYVEIVAHNFQAFSSLVVAARDASILECISYTTPESFFAVCKNIPLDDAAINRAVAAITNAFSPHEVVDVYGQVRKLQKQTDLSTLRFSDEYYTLTGL